MTAPTDTEVKALNPSDLEGFTGSENCYRHGLNPDVLFTDGAKYVADTAGAYWLLDEIALSQLVRRGRGIPGLEAQGSRRSVGRAEV